MQEGYDKHRGPITLSKERDKEVRTKLGGKTEKNRKNDRCVYICCHNLYILISNGKLQLSKSWYQLWQQAELSGTVGGKNLIKTRKFQMFDKKEPEGNKNSVSNSLQS